jgi:hypothetical protein
MSFFDIAGDRTDGPESLLKKASEYRQNAAECRQLAAGVKGIQRDQLLEMAATWEQLAADRSDLVQRYPEFGQDAEPSELRAASTGKCKN